MPVRRRQLFETLERRDLMTSVPFGASSQDTAEFLLGDVAINVVLLESNGAVDPSSEDWTPELVEQVKANIEEGALWWSETLAMYSDVHELNFTFDYQFADTPFSSSYEPITRPSQDVAIWVEEFFREVDVPASAGFATEIREFNHRQRMKHDTNWSFTIFVVNADNDPNDRFGNEDASNTEFRRAFAYPGGQFIVMPHSRPASTVAHELAHMFWAHDEYSGSDPYTARRGYYATQNTNGATGHPDLASRESSLMATTSIPYANHAISQSARETLGWRDSDGDGIFDVLDVDHQISGTATLDPTTRRVRFEGSSSVQTLPNQNTVGTGNDMTINRITGLQYQVNDGEWLDLLALDGYQVDVTASTPPVPAGTQTVAFRTIDHRIGVTSAEVQLTMAQEPPVLQNPVNRYDVNNDTHVAPNDVLTLVQAINRNNIDLTRSGPPYLDVSGDGFVSPVDVLILVRYINDVLFAPADQAAALTPATTNSETTVVGMNAMNVAPAAEPIAPHAASDVVFALLASQDVERDDDDKTALDQAT